MVSYNTPIFTKRQERKLPDSTRKNLKQELNHRGTENTEGERENRKVEQDTIRMIRMRRGKNIAAYPVDLEDLDILSTLSFSLLSLYLCVSVVQFSK